MLPIAEVVDESRRERALAQIPAVVVGSLVVANIAAFIYEMALIEAGDDELTLEWGLVPRMLTRIDARHGVETIFTSMFLHGGWAHLLGNLWFLWIFGRSVERNLGSIRFLALYLLSGVTAAVVQVAVDPSSRAPMIGASGAIAGVLSAYVSLYPWRRIRTLIPIFILPWVISLPAFVIVFEWFVLNLFQGLGSLKLRTLAQGGTAWWAHVGGFVAGLVLVRLLFPEQPPSPPRASAARSSWNDGDDRGRW